jgi:hypothetical protein
MRQYLSQYFRDLAWAWRMVRCRRYRRGLLFSRRLVFDKALRRTFDGSRYTYPDAFYAIDEFEVQRAIESVENSRGQRAGE